MGLARIGIGANLGDAPATVRAAIAALDGIGRVARASSLYATKAWGVDEQPDFINAAVLLETPLEPHALLRELKRLESELGRTPSFRWGPRQIDLDILAYDDLHVDDPDLTVPHRDLHRRAFALVPLAEIDAAYENALRALPAGEVEGVRKVSG